MSPATDRFAAAFAAIVLAVGTIAPLTHIPAAGHTMALTAPSYVIAGAIVAPEPDSTLA